MTLQLYRFVVVSVLLMVFGGGSTFENQDVSSDLVALNDLGVAQMGQFQYATAHETFLNVVAQVPWWSTARVNLAIATLNRQEPNDELRTLGILSRVLDDEPSNVRALYTSGIVHLYLGEPEKAIEYFQQVVELDPSDAYAAYFLGQSYLQSENYEEALRWLLSALDLNPSLRSAYWVASTAARRIGDAEHAMELVETYQRFEHNPLSVTAGISYKEMGPKAEAMSSTLIKLTPRPLPEGYLFASHTVIDSHVTDATSVTSADFNDDDHWDLLIGTTTGSSLYKSDGKEFSLVEDLPYGDVVHQAAFWGDLENDGVLDLILCTEQGIQVWQASDGGGISHHCASSSFATMVPSLTLTTMEIWTYFC